MPFITTKSYTLATYENNAPNSTKCAIVLPGRLESKDYAHIRSHVDLLATLGYHALAFDPPGSWDSPGGIEQYTITNYLTAVNEVIEHYGNKPTVLVGHSLGGSIAILAAERNPQVTAFVSLMALVGGPKAHDTEWETDGKVTFYRDMPPGDHHTPEQKRYDLPYSFMKDAQQYNTQATLQQCTTPKLLVVGTHDAQNVPKYTPAEYALIAEPKQIIEVEAYHSYRYSEAMINTVNHLIKAFVLSQT